jgi:hypothetical protein
VVQTYGTYKLLEGTFARHYTMHHTKGVGLAAAHMV